MSESRAHPIDYFHAFKETPYGEKAQGMTRWDLFRPFDVEPEEWQQIMGADVNNLEHGRLQYGIVRIYVKTSNELGEDIDPESQRKLETAAIIHDQHETLPGHGDHRTGTKTELHKIKELVEGRAALLDTSFYPDLTPEARQEAANVLDEVLSEETGDPVLTRQFKAAEYLNHLRTGLIAMNKLGSLTGEPQIKFKPYLEALVADCMINVIPVLRRLAPNDPVVRSVLTSQHDAITRCFSINDGWQTYFGDDSETMLMKYKAQKHFFSWSGSQGTYILGDLMQ